MMSFDLICSSSTTGTDLFPAMAKTSHPRALILSKILQLGVSKSTSLCRFRKQICRHLAMMIALCLMFSMVPVVGSKVAARSARDNAIGNIVLSSFELPSHHVLSDEVSRSDIEAGGPLHIPAGSKACSLASSYCAQSHSARRSLQALPKPEDGPVIQTSQGGVAECDLHCGEVARLAHQTQASLADAKLLSAESGIRSLLSYGYMRLKRRFQVVKEFAEGETDIIRDHNVVSHGLIRLKLLEVDKGEYCRDDLERESDIHAGVATFHTMFPAGSPNLKGLHIGIGETREKVQIRNVVEALRKSGLFAAIAGVIEGMNLFMLPQFVTIFTPTDSAYQTIQHADIDQLALFQYHTVIQRYAFSQLCALREGTILYTMRPGYSISVTQKQSFFKISLDDVFVIAPDLYLDETIAVHGIDGIFNASLYGKNYGVHVPEMASPPRAHEASSNISNRVTPLASPLAGHDSGLNNGSTSAEAGQQGETVQPGANSDADNTHTSSSHLPASPLASEIASDIDASPNTVSASHGACYAAACAFFCALSF